MLKHPKPRAKSGRQRVCLFQWPATSIVASVAGRQGWAPTNSDKVYGGDGDVCVHVCALVRASRVYAYVCA